MLAIIIPLLLITSHFANTVVMFQVNVEELCPLDCVPQAKKKSNQLAVHYSQRPKSPVSPLQQEANAPEPQDSSRETREEGEGESDSSCLQVEETSVLTNGELSE